MTNNNFYNLQNIILQNIDNWIFKNISYIILFVANDQVSSWKEQIYYHSHP